ncbi:hypothetical protein [Burkholderia anthina]
MDDIRIIGDLAALEGTACIERLGAGTHDVRTRHDQVTILGM